MSINHGKAIQCGSQLTPEDPRRAGWTVERAEKGVGMGLQASGLTDWTEAGWCDRTVQAGEGR